MSSLTQVVNFRYAVKERYSLLAIFADERDAKIFALMRATSSHDYIIVVDYVADAIVYECQGKL